MPSLLALPLIFPEPRVEVAYANRVSVSHSKVFHFICAFFVEVTLSAYLPTIDQGPQESSLAHFPKRISFLGDGGQGKPRREKAWTGVLPLEEHSKQVLEGRGQPESLYSLHSPTPSISPGVSPTAVTECQGSGMPSKRGIKIQAGGLW